MPQTPTFNGKTLLGWVGYWDRARRGPNLHKVHSLADMATCRTYNPVMTAGRMGDVSDQMMWDALCAYCAELTRVPA